MNNNNGQSAAEQTLVKPIKGWEDLYTISSDGKVFSIRNNRYLTPSQYLDGYQKVTLSNGSIRRTYRVHRLVAEAFLENPDNLPQVNHKDFNKLNNYLENLEWCTNYDNTHYSMDANRDGFGKQPNNRSSVTGRFENCKAYTFTNVYNNKQFTIIGMKNVIKQFGCSLRLFKCIVSKYANTGAYVKQGFFKGLKIDSEYLQVQRLTPSQGVESSDSK